MDDSDSKEKSAAAKPAVKPPRSKKKPLSVKSPPRVPKPAKAPGAPAARPRSATPRSAPPPPPRAGAKPAKDGPLPKAPPRSVPPPPPRARVPTPAADPHPPRRPPPPPPPPPPPARSAAPSPPARAPEPAGPVAAPPVPPPAAPKGPPIPAAAAPPAAPAAGRLRTKIGHAVVEQQPSQISDVGVPPADSEPTHLRIEPAAAQAPVPPELPVASERRLELARELVAHCEAELSTRPDKARAARLHYEAARQYEGALGEPDRAWDHYQRALELSPDHLPSLHGARRALVIQKKHSQALPLYDREIRAIADPHKKAVLLYEKGVLLEDRVGKRREAQQAYRAALDLDESNPTILKALERAEALASAWDELSKTYEREANAVSSDARHRAAVIAERARLVEAKHEHIDEAIELYETALEIDPTAPGALPALKHLLYTAKRWRDLIHALERQADLASDAGVRAMARYRIARLHFDRLGNVDEAVAALEIAQQDAPGDTMIVEELARLYELSRRWDKLVRSLEQLAELAPGGSRMGLYHRIGQIEEERLESEDAAIEWYRRALDGDPAYVPALQALGKLYARRGQWTALIAMHLGEAGASRDNARRAAAHSRVAEILERQLGNVEPAIEHHQRALGLVFDHAPSFKALVRLFSEGGRHRELAELYERAVDLATDDETKITYLFKIGRLHEDALGAPQSAVHAYKRILDIDRGHLGAIHAVQRAAERAGLHKELIEALEREAEHTSDRARRVVLLHRAGEITERELRDDDGALERYRRVVELDGKYSPALSSLGRIHYRAGRWDDLLEVYRLELAVIGGASDRAALLYKMGELCEERIGREDEAVRCYQQSVEADAMHTPSLRALVRLLGARGDDKEVVRLLELELSSLDDPAARARTAFRIGEVHENRLLQPGKALAAYERALADVPDFTPALDGRARLLEQAKDHKALADALAKEAQAASDPLLFVSAKLREGEIRRDALDQPQRAIEAFEAVRERDPNHVGALLALEALYASQGAYDKLADNLGQQARVLQNGLARVAALHAQARVQEARELVDSDELTQTYLSIVRMSPADGGALDALERLGLTRNDPTLLSHVDAKLGAMAGEDALVAAHQTRLAELLEAAGDPSALDTYRAVLARDPDNLAAARGLSRIAERARDPALLGEGAEVEARVLRDLDRAARLLVESAKLRVARGDLDGAVADVERALDTHPDHAPAADLAVELLTRAGDVGKLLDLLGRAASGAKDADRRAALWVSVATTQADRNKDFGAALSAVARALKERPRFVSALMKQADFYARSEQWPEAAQSLERALGAPIEDESRVAANLQLAWIAFRHLGDAKRARTNLEAVLEVDGGHRGALSQLLDLQLSRDELDGAAATAARLVEASMDPGARAEALTKLGQLERRRGRPGEAAAAYREALVTAGAASSALADFKSLIAEQKKKGEAPSFAEYAEGLEGYLKHAPSADRSLAPLYVELGRVLSDELGQLERGLSVLREALSLSGDDAAIRTELARRLVSAGRMQPAVVELKRLLEVDAMRAQTWRDLVDVLDKLGHSERAEAARGVLVALGGGTDMEQVNVQSRHPRPAACPAGAFDATALSFVDASRAEDAPLTELLEAVVPALSRVYVADFESYGLVARDRIGARSGHPLRALSDRVAAAFGLEEYDLYVHQAHQGAVEVEFADPPAIMMPAHLTRLPESQQVFVLARVMLSLVRGVSPIDKLAPQQVMALVTAAARNVEPSFGSGQGDDEYLESLGRRIYKALPRRGRRPLEEAAARYISAAKPDFAEWAQRARMTATRGALVVCDDIGGAVQLLRRTEGDRSGIEGGALRRGQDILEDAMRFVVSEEYVSARKRLGL